MPVAGRQVISLRPKTIALLRCLVEHPGQLLTKAALFDAVWPDTAVSDVVLTVCIRELRQALGDDVKTPQFIETVHRRGYRFVGRVTALPDPGAERQTGLLLQIAPKSVPLGTRHSTRSTVALVGREAELGHLHRVLAKALGGLRQVLFVTGEAGLGKTTLIETFVKEATSRGSLWIGRGQCIEYYGSGEAYMPVLEALGRLCRGPGGQKLIELLGRYAPTWLVQMPALVSATHLKALQRKTLGATRERMLREMAEAIEALTAEQALMLVLEDLHWSDYATLDLVAALAQRQEPARLLVLGTYRPEEATMSQHPLRTVKQELQLHGHCEELPLTFLTETALQEYLAVRFPGTPLPAGLARIVHRRTDGNPLFMVNMVEDWLARGLLVESDGQWALRVELGALQAGVPESLQQMIEKRLDRLRPEEQRIIEVGSIAGVEFSASAVAAGLEMEVAQIEEGCEELARRSQLLQPIGEQSWPDRTVAGAYRFVHALYHEVVYSRVTGARRTQLHRRIGARLEEGYGAQVHDMAAALAVHFERGRDDRRAIGYLRQAADNALRRSANADAVSHLTKALALLATLPDTAERTQQELNLQVALGASLMAIKGYAAPEVVRAYARARELCQQVGEISQLVPVVWGLHRFHQARAELKTAHELGEQLLSLAHCAQDPAALVEAHRALGQTLLQIGEVSAARAHLEEGIALYDPPQHRSLAFRYGLDPRVACLTYAALALWWLGHPDQALGRIHEALTLAQELAHPYSLATALFWAAWIHQFRRETPVAQERAEAAIALATEQGFPLPIAFGTVIRGWALAVQGQGADGVAQILQGLAAWRATGGELHRPYFLALLAEACGHSGEIEEGLRALDEALTVVNKTGAHWWEAELYRLKGELLKQQAEDGKQQTVGTG